MADKRSNRMAVPGILTGTAALITALLGLLNQKGTVIARSEVSSQSLAAKLDEIFFLF